MADLGKLRPGFWDGQQVTLLTFPIAVVDRNGDSYPVTNVYVDENHLIIDIDIENAEKL